MFFVDLSVSLGVLTLKHVSRSSAWQYGESKPKECSA